MSSSVLVVVAHADDEVFGCGGTIARHISEGDTVQIVYMTDGVGARGGKSIIEAANRNSARECALRTLGVSDWYSFDFPDNRMDSVQLLDVVQALEPIVEATCPSIVYTHHFGDLNVDHRITHQAVMTSCRPQPSCSVREIFTFEVMSNTEWAYPGHAQFAPNAYVDISNFLDTKKKAIASYQIEMRPAPHSRCFEHFDSLARHHGYSIGVGGAEAFMIMRYIR